MLTTLRNQKGFTLVEMAIVLIIIGLLLGGVLKGQELIDNSRAKRAVSDLNSVAVAYNGYVDRYGRIPGDDGPLGTLQLRGGAWTTITAAGPAPNGVLNITPAQTFGIAGESLAFWQAVRAAGYITGDHTANTVATAIPINPFQGLMGVAVNPAVPITGMDTGVSVCISQVPGKIAAQIDTLLDNGNPATGSVRATLGAAGVNTVPAAAAPNPYVETSVYTVCRKIN